MNSQVESAADRHDLQCDGANVAVGGDEPEKSGDAGRDRLEVHSRRRHRGAAPLARERPGVGHVAIQAGGAEEQHDADAAALSAEGLAGEPVTKFVKDLHGADRDEQSYPAAGREAPRGVLKLSENFVEPHRQTDA